MPSTQTILDNLGRIANQGVPAAVAWHLLIACVLLALFMGWIPQKRTAALLLVVPLLSVSVVAAKHGNPFNMLIVGLGSFALAVLGVRPSTDSATPPWPAAPASPAPPLASSPPPPSSRAPAAPVPPAKLRGFDEQLLIATPISPSSTPLITIDESFIERFQLAPLSEYLEGGLLRLLRVCSSCRDLARWRVRARRDQPAPEPAHTRPHLQSSAARTPPF